MAKKPFRFAGDDKFLQGEGAWKKGEGGLEFSAFCMESYPCQHYVRIDGVDQDTYWSGTKIVNWCKEHKVPVPEHFAYLLK
jgi:hypothetical protein